MDPVMGETEFFLTETVRSSCQSRVEVGWGMVSQSQKYLSASVESVEMGRPRIMSGGQEWLSSELGAFHSLTKGQWLGDVTQGNRVPWVYIWGSPHAEFTLSTWIYKRLKGFPGGSGVRNPTANARDKVPLIPDRVRFHTLWSDWVRAPQLLSLCSREEPPLATTRESPYTAKKVQHSQK